MIGADPPVARIIFQVSRRLLILNFEQNYWYIGFITMFIFFRRFINTFKFNIIFNNYHQYLSNSAKYFPDSFYSYIIFFNVKFVT